MGIAHSDPHVQRDFYPPTAYAWYVVAILLLVGVASHLDRYIISLLVEPIKADLGLTDTEVSILQGTSFALFFVAFSMPCGALVDRVNRPMLLAAGITMWSVMTALGGLADTFWELFATRAGIGISEACLAPAAFSLIADYFPPARRGRAMSTYNMANYLGGGSSLIVGGFVYGMLGGGVTVLPLVGGLQGWQATLVIVGSPGILLAFLMLTVREPTGRSSRVRLPEGPREGFLKHMRDAPLVYFAVHGVSAMTAFTGFAVIAWLPSYFIRTFGLAPSSAGQMIGPISITAGMAGCILSGICSDWLVARGRVGGRFLLPLVWWPLALTGIVLLISAEGTVMALVGVFVFTLGSGFGLASVAPTIQDITPGRFRGQATSLHFVLSGLFAFGAAPTLVALVNDYFFRDPAALGKSMLVVLLPVIIAGFSICLLARKAYDGRRRIFLTPFPVPAVRPSKGGFELTEPT